jgi:DNA-binding NtrC family response regulator
MTRHSCKELPTIHELPTVLVIDDDSAMRALLRDWLEHGGFRVIEEPNADRLLATAGATPLDVVVLDKEMPGQSGFDVLPAFKRRWPHVPVILITAFGGGAVAEEALRLGARVYLEKPFQLRALLEAVRNATAGARRTGHP